MIRERASLTKVAWQIRLEKQPFLYRMVWHGCFFVSCIGSGAFVLHYVLDVWALFRGLFFT